MFDKTHFRQNVVHQVICNHLTPGRGRGIALEMSKAFNKVWPRQPVQGKYPEFALYRQKGP